MITVEEKLNIFSKLIFEKVQNESDEILDKMYRENKKIIEDYRDEIKKKEDELINKKVRSGQLEKNRMISDANSEYKKNILNKNNDLFKRMIRQIERLAREFTTSEKYVQFLNKILMNVLSEFEKDESITIFVMKKDYEKHIENILKSLIDNNFDTNRVKIEIIPKDIIGGVIIVNSINTIRIDLSIKNKIEENKNYIGQMLYKEFDKVSDKNE